MAAHLLPQLALPLLVLAAQPAAEPPAGAAPPPAPPAATAPAPDASGSPETTPPEAGFPETGEPRSPWGRGPRNPWTISLEPSLWYASPSGDLVLPGGTGGRSTDEFRLDELGLDSPTLEPMGQVHLLAGRWRLTLDGFYVASEGGAFVSPGGRFGTVNVASGDFIETDFTLWTAEATGSFRLTRFADGTTDTGGDKFVFGLDVIAGARALGVEFESEVTRNGAFIGETSADETFIQPIVGIRLEFKLYERLLLDVAADVGYISSGDESLMTRNIRVGVSVEVIDNVGLQLGYRNLAVEMESGDDADEFSWDGGIAGYYWGLRLLF